MFPSEVEESSLKARNVVGDAPSIVGVNSDFDLVWHDSRTSRTTAGSGIEFTFDTLLDLKTTDVRAEHATEDAIDASLYCSFEIA